MGKKFRLTRRKGSRKCATNPTKIKQTGIQNFTGNVSNTSSDSDIDLDYDPDYNPDVEADCEWVDDELDRSINSTSDPPITLSDNNTNDQKRSLHECYEWYEWYECYICHKLYKGKDNFIAHLCVPNGEKKCNKCNKTYIGQDAFTGHKCIQVGEKPHDIEVWTYECYFCHKLYKDNYKFTTHVCIQTGPGQYKCNICHTLYARRLDLRRHKCKQIRNKSNNCTKDGKGLELADLKPHRPPGRSKKAVKANVMNNPPLTSKTEIDIVDEPLRLNTESELDVTHDQGQGTPDVHTNSPIYDSTVSDSKDGTYSNTEERQ